VSATGASIDTPRRRDWDAVAAVVATLVGLLALLVSGYTAHIQREQVRAQVWPYLLVGGNDPGHSLVAFNKGVGPAIVRSVQVWVDGRLQPDWKHVLTAIGLPAHGFQDSTVSDNVLSAGEQIAMITIPDAEMYRRFRDASRARLGMEICFCSTLGDCWTYSDRVPGQRFRVRPSSCPALPTNTLFRD
jgi:hypothetical protein